jgi:tetratricopeptide (TPR) repeat protein
VGDPRGIILLSMDTRIGDMVQPDYDAFITYRRSDGNTVARWLRRELEGFRVPKPLRDTFGRRLRIYLDTAYERGASDFYEQNIKPALMSSRFLLVVATPDAMRRPNGAEDWIEREVMDFAAGPNGSNVIAIRGVGEFDAPLPADLNCRFPNIEIVDLRGASRFWFLNLHRAARLSAEKLKLVAPLLDIPRDQMPELREEEEKRQQTRLGGIVGTTLGVLVAVTTLSVIALQSRNQALRAADDSMFAAGTMGMQARSLDEDDAATARIRRLIINRGCDLIDKFRATAVSEPQIADIVACRLERAQERERQKEQNEARKQFVEAIALATQRHARLPRLDAALSLVEAREAYAAYFLRQNDAPGAEAEYGKLLEDARRLATAHEGRAQLIRPQAEALGQLGDIHAKRGDSSKAAASYDSAAVAVGQALETKSAMRDPDPRMIAWLARLYRLAGQQYMQLGDVEQASERYRRSLAAPARAGSDQRSPAIENETAITHAALSTLERGRGNATAAQTARTEALASIDRIVKSSQAAPDLKQSATRLKAWLESQDANK